MGTSLLFIWIYLSDYQLLLAFRQVSKEVFHFLKLSQYFACGAVILALNQRLYPRLQIPETAALPHEPPDCYDRVTPPDNQGYLQASQYILCTESATLGLP